jgi:hypothetical protein
MKITLYNFFLVFAQLGNGFEVMADWSKIFNGFHYEFETMCEAIGDIDKIPTLRYHLKVYITSTCVPPVC